MQNETITKNEKQKSQKYNQKSKTDLKQRAYLYSIKLIKFIDQLSKDSSSQIIAKQLDFYLYFFVLCFKFLAFKVGYTKRNGTR